MPLECRLRALYEGGSGLALSGHRARAPSEKDGCRGCACVLGAELVALGELDGGHDRAGEELELYVGWAVLAEEATGDSAF